MGTVVDSQCYVVGGESFEPAAKVAIGESVHFECLDASGDQFRPGKALSDVDFTRTFPVSGPVFVEGVEPGDWVGVEIKRIKPISENAHVWTRPGLGIVPVTDLWVRSVPVDSLKPSWARDVLTGALPRRVHLGTVGAYGLDEMAARDLGSAGGNVDFVELGDGATMWVRAHHPGAGIYLGDTHLGIGDGEVCGTGLEVSARIDVVLHREPGTVGSLPRVTKGSSVWLLSFGATLEEAITKGVTEVCDCLVRSEGLAAEEAYLLTSLLLDVHVCQIVNPAVSVAVTLYGDLQRILLPC